MKKILITGAAGQLGTDLALDLISTRPDTELLLTDLKADVPDALKGIAYERLDVQNSAAVKDVLARFAPDEIYHLAALLSGTGEKNPNLAWDLNVTAYKNLLDIAVELLPQVKIFFPSSIAVFGPGAGRVAAQSGFLDPNSMYGVTKLAGEHLSSYYHKRYGLDIRSLRFPGLISAKAQPGGGTTDYSVEIFYAVTKGHPYTCYLKEETGLPFLFMPDALKAIHLIMNTDAAALSIRTSYNIHGFSATPVQFQAAVEQELGHPISVAYSPDFRQAIAESWPEALVDDNARKDWNWAPSFTLQDVTKHMLQYLAAKLPSA